VGGGGGFKKGEGAVSNNRGKVLVFYLSLLVLSLVDSTK